ncbi:hypothetical protein ACQ4PT_050966 [Festuca glaucescens]
MGKVEVEIVGVDLGSSNHHSSRCLLHPMGLVSSQSLLNNSNRCSHHLRLVLVLFHPTSYSFPSGGYPQQIFPNQFDGPWQQPRMPSRSWPQQQQQQAPQKLGGENKSNQQGRAQKQQSKEKEVIKSAGNDGKSQDGCSVLSTGSRSTTAGKANIHPPHPDPDDHEDDQGLEEENQKEGDNMDTGNQNTTNSGLASAGGSRTNLGVAPADKQKNGAALSKKVYEIAQFYMNQRDVASLGPSLLSPIPDPVSAKEKVLSWIHQTTNDDNCINLLQDMELFHEEDVFFADQEHEISHMELSKQATNVPQANTLKKWGPVAGTRQSSRFTNNEGKAVMQLAQELAPKKTLEKVIPASSKISDKNVTIPTVSEIHVPVIHTSTVNHMEGDSYDDDFPDALGWTSIGKKN